MEFGQVVFEIYPWSDRQNEDRNTSHIARGWKWRWTTHNRV